MKITNINASYNLTDINVGDILTDIDMNERIYKVNKLFDNRIIVEVLSYSFNDPSIKKGDIIDMISFDLIWLKRKYLINKPKYLGKYEL